MKPFEITEYGIAEKGICFIFGAWRFHKLGYVPGIKRMTRLGIKCILFVPNPNIISPGEPYVNLIAAANFASKKVNDYLREQPKNIVGLTLGLSLGTLFAMDAAKRHPEINRIILAAPFGDFADHVGGWKTHRLLKRFFEPQDTTGAELISALRELNTTTDISLLTGKQLHISYSTKDTFIHTAATQKLISNLQGKGISVNIRQNKGGHFTGIAADYLRFLMHEHAALAID